MLAKNVYSRQYSSINQNNLKINEIKPKTSFNNLNNIPLKQSNLLTNTQREFGKDITNQFHLTTFMNKENINQQNKEIKNEKNSFYILNNQENKKNIPKTFEINFPKPRKLQSQEKITSQNEIYMDYEKKLNYSNELKNKNQSQKEETKTLQNSSFNSSISDIIIINDKEDFKEIINELKNPQEVDDYFNDIYTYFKEEE